MASSPASKRLKKLADEIPRDTVLEGILHHLESDSIDFSDHAIALLGASIVEKALEVAIRARFRSKDEEACLRMFRYDYRGPLADFSARIKIAYVLGIVGPKSRDDLDHVREVRNAFAHFVKFIRFDTKEVADICDLFHTPTTTTLLGSMGGNTPRGRYINTALTLATRLKGSIEAPTKNSLLAYAGIMKRDALLH